MLLSTTHLLLLLVLNYYLFCVIQDYLFTTVISIQNTSVLKIIPSSLSSYGNECANKIIRHVGFALYTKYIRLARFGCGFMISCKFVSLVSSNSSLPLDSTDAASLKLKMIKNKQPNLSPLTKSGNLVVSRLCKPSYFL